HFLPKGINTNILRDLKTIELPNEQGGSIYVQFPSASIGSGITISVKLSIFNYDGEGNGLTELVITGNLSASPINIWTNSTTNRTVRSSTNKIASVIYGYAGNNAMLKITPSSNWNNPVANLSE